MARIPRRLALLAAVTLLGLSTLTIDPPVAHAASTATVDGARIHQPIDGFGFSEAFGRGAIMHGSEGLSAGRQREVLDLLLSRTTGAGLSILRLHIGSTANSSIQPTNPGGPNATPRYVWDRDDDSQVWLAQQAKAYGVTLCGLSGASCASGDWRTAYANCNHNANQRWTSGGGTLRSVGTCLDVPAGAASGTRARLWACSGAANQQWAVNANGTITNGQTGRCLGVTDGVTANGGAVGVFTCNGSAGQRWTRP